MAASPAEPRTKKLLLGLLSAPLILMSVPPIGAWPLAFVALVPLILAVRGATPGRALALGWTVGLVVNLVGFHWLVDLGTRYGGLEQRWGALMLLGTALYQGSVLGWWALSVALLGRGGRVAELAGAPLSLAVLESFVPLIFPWYLAIAVVPAWPLVQLAELGGPPAVSALLVLLNVVAADLVASRMLVRDTRVAAVIAGALISIGLVRAGHVAFVRNRAPALSVAVVQPNFGITSAEVRKHDGEKLISILRNATTEAGKKKVDLVVWPESSFPFLFDRSLDREFAHGHPWELRGGFSGRLLFGSLTHTFGTAVTQNSAVLVSSSGRIAGTYDKQKLLMFGEYVPLAERFPEWAARTRARLPDWPEIAPGDKLALLEDGSLRVGALICYEDIFPEYVAEVARLRPNLLVTVANHAWFAGSSAASHAAALATLRSVETRRDLIRSTNDGVSSIVDALGRVQAQAPSRVAPAPAEALSGTVRLLSIPALGPRTIVIFPYLSVFGLVWVFWRARTPGRT